ncbi:DUF6708 domain-containing protein [Stenotrophomonas sp. MH1]|uniref:DUF6708 domain-containing protein n=2 Tax=Stenotrophomonas TaxID=40323 RepID=A0ABU5V7S9_9GAMM|nr:DUF6708 domain-containing protein [Stenotrophomonas sp. MH1]MEA5669411.1 DUF6708 domain-containing protein [Stenotrophomonas sp. MH1]
MLRETTVAEWKKAEPEVVFGPELFKENAHARRAPFRVLPADHEVSLEVDPVAFDAVLRVHPDALEVGTVRGEYSKDIGWSKFSAFFMWSFGLLFFSLMVYVNILSIRFERGIDLFIIATFGFGAYFMFCFGSYFWRSARINSLDDPVLFNRKSRLVCILPYIKGGFFKFWKSGSHGAPVSYRWDDQIKARIYSYIYFRGANLASEGFELGLLAIREGTGNEVEHLIQLGVQSNGFDSTQLALWEHIRQYMEEDGPPLQPGDKLRATDLSRVPEFPPEIVAAAGGPALDQEAIDQLVRQKARV